MTRRRFKICIVTRLPAAGTMPALRRSFRAQTTPVVLSPKEVEYRAPHEPCMQEACRNELQKSRCGLHLGKWLGQDIVDRFFQERKAATQAKTLVASKPSSGPIAGAKWSANHRSRGTCRIRNAHSGFVCCSLGSAWLGRGRIQKTLCGQYLSHNIWRKYDDNSPHHSRSQSMGFRASNTDRIDRPGASTSRHT